MPLVGTWIEISFDTATITTSGSCPSWARGLKFAGVDQIKEYTPVVPLVGTWIEIVDPSEAKRFTAAVVPLVGTWIEI